MTTKDIIVKAFKNEIMVLVDAYGIKKTVEVYEHTDPFAYIDHNVDPEEFLEESLGEER